MEKTQSESTAMTVPTPGATALRFREATDAAQVCKAIVLKTACQIGNRKYVKVEGWMSIAVAHGCIASIREVKHTENGIVATAEVRRISDGVVLTTAEGYVGRDEAVWFGGTVTKTKWNNFKKKEETLTTVYPRREEFAIRAMAQTRAISRACRTAFAHVVVLMNEGLETVPAEEVNDTDAIDVDTEKAEGTTPPDKTASTTPPAAEQKTETKATPPATEPPKRGFDSAKKVEVPRDPGVGLSEQFRGGKWSEVVIHFGKNYKGTKLGELSPQQLSGWLKWEPQEYKGRFSDDDLLLRAALDVAGEEATSS